jgi:hypothetical protein
MSYSEIIAVLSGDTSLLEKSKIEKKIAALESLQTSHNSEQANIRQELQIITEEVKEKESVLKEILLDESCYDQSLKLDDDGKVINMLQLDNCQASKNKEISEFLKDLYNNYFNLGKSEIGTLYGFRLYIERRQEIDYSIVPHETRYFNYFFAQRDGGFLKYTHNGGVPVKDNHKATASMFLEAIGKCKKLRGSYEHQLSQRKVRQEQLSKMAGKPFSRLGELNDLRIKLRQLICEIQDVEKKKSDVITLGYEANYPKIDIPDVDFDNDKLGKNLGYSKRQSIIKV